MLIVEEKTRLLVAASLTTLKQFGLNYIKHPDDPAEHAVNWHQFGILTHSKRFQMFLEKEGPAYLQKAGVVKAAEAVLNQQIDGITKWQLLQLAAVLHDIGKFTARRAYGDGFNFKGHEVDSGKIIRGKLEPFFKTNGLTAAQIAYIASCAQLHFELGKIRREATSYTINFVKSAQFRAACRRVMQQYPQFALEIGLCFLADSLSKVEYYAQGESDSAIQAQKPQLEAKLAAKKLNPNLIKACLKIVVDIKAAEMYLKEWRLTNG